MLKRFYRSDFLLAFFASVLIGGSWPVQAQASDAGDDGWQFAIAPYLWGSDLGGKTQSGTEIDVPIEDIVDNLEMAFMISFEARRNKWLILSDYIYLDVATSEQVGPLPIDLDLEGSVFHLAGGYSLYQEKSSLDLVFGARNLDLELGLRAKIIGTPVSGSQSGSTLDAFVGAKGQLVLNDRWFVPYYADVGAGDSDLTWQATAGVSFRVAKWVDLALVYRRMEWEFGSDKLLKDLSFSGPAFGAIFRL